MPFLTHSIKTTGEQHDSSLLILTLITVFVKFLHQEVTLPSLTFSYCPFWEEVTEHRPQLRSGSYSPILYGAIATFIRISSAWEVCLSFLTYYVFSHLLILVWTLGCLFYILGYNALILLLKLF